MKLVLALFVCLFSANALAFGFLISDETIQNACLETAKNKIQNQADSYGCEVDLNQVVVQDTDNRWYNPSKYIWYEHKGECNGKPYLRELVQYYGGDCL